MTNHLKYIDVREYARVVDIARELIERAEQAEAAIARVREIRTPSVGLWPERPDAWFNGYAAALEVVRRALDGGAE